LREEFRIDLPRPRDINSPEVATHARQIMGALKGHLGGGSEAIE
jgi:NitT/TauT family transport system ATP-binding protein